jgi:protein-S-isoprenylcysteine O-methyltransferase Ste14
MALLALLYALLAYALFLCTFLYAIGFCGNVPLLPKTIDGGTGGPLVEALIINVALLAGFGLQHSVMARRGFKRWFTRVVPASMERATFVLAASAALALLMWQWRPLAEPELWSVTAPAARFALIGVSVLGWLIVLVSTYLLDHFELFGLRQPWVALRNQALPAPHFRTPLLYRHVRHPIYLGFALAFWATPHMSVGHALFAGGLTAYILVGIWFEERDLIVLFGQRYLAYRQRVGMLLPKLPLRRDAGSTRH